MDKRESNTRSSGVPETGAFRLRLHLAAGRTVLVGSFPSLSRCATFALDLVTSDGPQLTGLDIQHRNRRQWRPIRQWRLARAEGRA